MISYDVTELCDPYLYRYAVFNDDGSLAELKVCNITNVSHETLTVVGLTVHSQPIKVLSTNTYPN